MPYFKWKGKDPKGKIKKGEIVASDKNDALAKLKSKKITVITIKPAPKEIEIPFIKKVSEKELLIFTKQLSIMLASGLPLDQSLSIIADQMTNKHLGEIVYRIKSDIESGSTLANALKKHKNVFSTMYVNMVNSGEKTGNLDGVLKRLTEMMEKSIALKRKIRGAMIYPTIVSIVAVGVITLIMTFVIPTFAQMYSSSGMSLPLPTRIVIAVSLFLKNNIGYLLAGLIALIIFIRILYKKNYKFHRFVDKVLLHIPILGVLARKGSIANFSAILASLSASGIDILEALEIAAKTAGNLIIEETLMEVRDMVKRGENLSTAMAASGEFPDMVIQMVSVGEETGTLEEMLQKVYQYYEEEVDNTVKNLTNMIEPVIIVVLGSIIGFLVISMYLPIFKIGETIR